MNVNFIECVLEKNVVGCVILVVGNMVEIIFRKIKM